MRLAALGIQNFKCIGPEGCLVPIDEIVVLIGPNNAGKSTILDAYEAFASTGSSLPQEHFHKENAESPVEIEGYFNHLTSEDLETLGKKWAHEDERFGPCIRAKYYWPRPGEKASKRSFDPETSTFVEGGLGGWDSLLTSRIPKPTRIRPTDSAEETQAKIMGMLKDHVKNVLKGDGSRKAPILEQIDRLAAQLFEEAKEDLNAVAARITSNLSQVFPGASIELVPRSKDAIDEKLIAAASFISVRAGEGDNNASIPLLSQGTGLQRALLWSALSVMAEARERAPAGSPSTSRILLIDEPEAFLHPPAIRTAREALYAFAIDNPVWQVIATTHSPVLIDVSKPHTSIVRVRAGQQTDRFLSTDSVSFNEEERKRLQMIRACNPIVNEFFFYDDIVLVEGPTEQLVVQHVAKINGRPVHVIDCMGKANIPLFSRILNHFKASYLIVHDSDTPRVRRKGKLVKNGAWTTNWTIREDATAKGLGRIFVQVPHFEGEFLGESLQGGKVDRVLEVLGDHDSPECQAVLEAYSRLLGGDETLLANDAASFERKFRDYRTRNQLDGDELWAEP